MFPDEAGVPILVSGNRERQGLLALERVTLLHTFQQHQFNVNQFNLHLGSKSMIYNAKLLTFPADEAAEEPKPSLSVSTLSSTAPGRSVASAARVSKTWMLLLCIATTRISKQYSYSNGHS